MIFNPLFFNDIAGSEVAGLAKSKLGNSNYLFSDIIKVYMNEDTLPVNTSVEGVKLSLSLETDKVIDVQQMLDSSKIDLSKLLKELGIDSETELKSFLKSDEAIKELNLTDVDLDELVEKIVDQLPIALFANLNAEAVSKDEIKELVKSEIKKQITNNNSLVINTTEGKIELEILEVKLEKQPLTEVKPKTENAVLKNEKAVPVQNINQSSSQAAGEKSSSENPVVNLASKENQDKILNNKAISLPVSDIKMEELPKEMKLKLLKIEAAETSKNPEVKISSDNEKIKFDLSETKSIKTDNPENNKMFKAFNAEITTTKEVKNTVKTELESIPYKEVKVENRVATEKAESPVQTQSDKKEAVSPNQKPAEIKPENSIKEQVVIEKVKIVEEEKIQVENTKQVSRENPAAEKVKITDSEKPVNENSKVTVKEKATVEASTASNDSQKERDTSNSSDQSKIVNELLNHSDKKVSSKSEFTLPVSEQKERIVKAPEIIKEISKFIQKSDRSSITLKIEPEQLGKVKILLDMKENVVNARIEVENEAIKHVVENKINELYNNLSQNGVQLNSLNVSLSQAENKNYKPFTPKKKGNGKNGEEGYVDIEEEKSAKSYGYNTYEFLV